MKTVAVVTTVMDFSKQDELQRKDIVCEQEYLPDSSYMENISEEERHSVNNAEEWPMSHNKESEQRFPFTCNGYHSKTRAAHITCTGRITRIPSRYLDTETSDDYSTMVSRLKVKRRRKSSNNKLLVNGCNDNNDVFPLKLPILRPENLICNLDNEKLGTLANYDYPEVFNEPSLLSNKKTISPISKHGAKQTVIRKDRTSNSRRNASDSVVQVSLNGVMCANSGTKHGLNEEVSICCSQTTTTTSSSANDISKDNSQRCAQFIQAVACDNQSTGEMINGEENVVMQGNIKNYLDTTPSMLSSTQEFVSSKQMSCTANLHENNDYIALQNNKNATVINGCLKSGCIPNESGENVIEFDKLSPCRSEQKALINTTTQESTKQDLDYLKNLKMARRKFVHNKKRRGPTSKNKLKKPTEFNAVNRVIKTIKPHRIVERKQKCVDKQNSGEHKTSKEYSNLDQVLGMRHGPFGGYEFLVEWANGTSCWVSAQQIVDNKHNGVLRKYLMEQDHDISVVKRVPFEAYCCDSLSLKECPQEIDVFDEDTLKCPVSADEQHVSSKKEVMTEMIDDCCYIMLMRETCKRKLTSLKIVNDLIDALEDASVADCSLVVLKGLGGKIFAGFDVDTVCQVDIQEKGNEILQRIRYLVQTLSNYPKPIIGLISQPAEGIGAAFLSLFDMICDEAAWEEQPMVDQQPLLSFSQCCLPRATGHSISYEDILMGKNCVDEKMDICSLSENLGDSKETSPVMETLSHIKGTLTKFGKMPNSLIDITSEGITQMTNISLENIEDIAQEISSCLTDDSSQTISSCPAGRYVKELEAKILEEKHLVQKYINEISTLWNNPSSSSDQCSSSSQNCL